MAAGSPHPDNIMVSPLYIHRMITAERIQNDMRPGPPVKNISDDVQMVNDQPLNQIAQGNDKFRRPADTDNGMDNFVIISFLVLYLRLLRNQLLYYVGKVFRQSLPYLGTGIL